MLASDDDDDDDDDEGSMVMMTASLFLDPGSFRGGLKIARCL
jgi:hypothetical protein